MSSSLLTPWWRPRSASHIDAPGSLAPTPILDWLNPTVSAFLDALPGSHGPRELLQAAHKRIAHQVRAVYAVQEAQPASRTLARGRGSCSQRLAVLEAVARASGTPTRVRGLLVDGSFWYPRFPHVRFAVPTSVLVAWPEFELDGEWTSVSALFGEPGTQAGSRAFTNAGPETLFDAIARTAVDWDGVTSTPEVCSSCDLSALVVRDLGRFSSRDELFATHGQTLCWPTRALADPFLSRWSAKRRVE